MKKLTGNEKGKGKVSHIQINYSDPLLSDLPDNILVNILLRLTVKRIFVCKCVCKTWYDLISDPDFAKLHFNQAQVYPLLHSWIDTYTSLSEMHYLVQPEQDDFDRKIEMSYDSSPIRFKLDSKLKLPLCNIQMILDKEEVESENCIKLNMKNHKYRIVNSCNGLLSLSNLSNNEPVIVCNPVTGEFINLPEVRTVTDDTMTSLTHCGLGFSPVANQYKVIRMFSSCRRSEQNRVAIAEVHTLGTQSWRVLCSLPNSTSIFSPTYLNGRVYWYCYSLPQSVISFDIEKECFESISQPPLDHHTDEVSMGVLGGELVMSASNYNQHNVRFWAMKDDGATKSWSQIFSFDNERLPDGPYQPIKYLNNAGELLIFNSYEEALICMDTRKNKFRYLKVRDRGYCSEVEAIAHIPSLVPLKHALSGHTVEVFSVKSGCREIQLHKEGHVIFIIEKDMSTELDSEDIDQI